MKKTSVVFCTKTNKILKTYNFDINLSSGDGYNNNKSIYFIENKSLDDTGEVLIYNYYAKPIL